MKKGIYIDGNYHKFLGVYLPRILFALGANESSIATDIIVFSGKSDPESNYNEFLGTRIRYVHQRRNIVAMVKAIIYAMYVCLKRMTDQELLNFSYKGVKYGGFLYDFILRNSAECTIKRIKISNFKSVTSFFNSLFGADYYFKRMRPAIYLTHEVAYDFEAVCVLAAQYDAEVYQCTPAHQIVRLNLDADIYRFQNDSIRMNVEALRSLGFADEYFLKSADELLGLYTNGDLTTESCCAYKDKLIVTKPELEDSYKDKFKSTRKTGVLMCHTFSDIAYYAESRKLYKDYYTWCEETLKIISDIKEYNWIVKAHPFRAFYHESDEVKRLFDKYDNHYNMIFWDDKLSTESLYDIADAVITVCGTCGVEFPCRGIPAIVAGNAYYSNRGFTNEANTIDEYIELLNGIDSLQCLDKEQIDTSKIVFSLYFHAVREGVDDFERTLGNNIKEDVDGKRDARKADEKVIHALKNLDYRNSTYFKAGVKAGLLIKNSKD